MCAVDFARIHGGIRILSKFRRYSFVMLRVTSNTDTCRNHHIFHFATGLVITGILHPIFLQMFLDLQSNQFFPAPTTNSRSPTPQIQTCTRWNALNYLSNLLNSSSSSPMTKIIVIILKASRSKSKMPRAAGACSH